ncbi:FUN14 family-domain-containing protein [Hyaloraphidium curvatum]|nr:FUN14 family-domain-containing protein [Hyaloraphidium curvatum]
MAATRISMMMRVPAVSAARTLFRPSTMPVRAARETRLFVSQAAPRLPAAAPQFARAGARRFTTGTAGYSSSFWGKGGVMLAGGLSVFGAQALMNRSEKSPLGLAVVECEAAPAADVDQLFGKQPSATEGLTTVLTLGGFLGFSTGYFFKKIGKVVLFFIGGAFVFLQYLVHKEFIRINWDAVGAGFNKRLDRDADGKVSVRDAGTVFGSLIRWLTHRVPFAAGFTAGFYLGFRAG